MHPIKAIVRVARHIGRNLVAYVALFIALGGVSYAAWLAPANSVNSAAIIDHQVTTPDLASNAVAADGFCLYGGCWGSQEIADNAVATSELSNGAVTSAKVANGAVTTYKLAAGAVANNQLGANAVTGDKVKDGSLSAADIAGGIPPRAEAYIARDNAEDVSGTGATVVSLNLPAGYYTLTAETSLFNEDGDAQEADCTLSTGAQTLVRLPGSGLSDSNPPEQAIVVEDLLTLTSPGTASLHCHSYRGLTRNTKLIAVKVAALHG